MIVCSSKCDGRVAQAVLVIFNLKHSASHRRSYLGHISKLRCVQVRAVRKKCRGSKNKSLGNQSTILRHRRLFADGSIQILRLLMRGLQQPEEIKARVSGRRFSWKNKRLKIRIFEDARSLIRSTSTSRRHALAIPSLTSRI